MRRLLVILPLLLVCVTVRAGMLERPVSDARIGFASASLRYTLTAAFNGERFLFIWTSADRGGQAMALDADGEPVNIAAGLPFRPFGAFWNGEVWIVVSSEAWQWVRVSADGVLLDREARAFPLGGPAVSMVWTGSALVIATEVRQSTFDPMLRLKVFDAQMRLQATHDIDTNASSPTLHSDGESALLLYRKSGGTPPLPVHAMMLDARGTPLHHKVLPAAYVAAVGTAGNGRGYRVIRWKYRPDQNLFTSFHLDHQLVQTESLDTYGSVSTPFGVGRTLTWDGTAFTFFHGVHAVRISESGVLLEDRRIILDTDHYRPLYPYLYGVAGAGRTLVIYETTSEEYGEGLWFLNMRGGRDLAEIAASDEHQLEQGAFQQMTPAAASSASQSLVVWRERLYSPAAAPWVLATRVDANGNVLDPQSIILGGSSCTDAIPAVASDGNGFLAAWYDSEGLMTAQVRADGTVAARTRVQRFRDTPCHRGAPKVISNGSGYFVVWTRELQFRDDVFGARLTPDGALLDTAPIPLGTTTARVDGASNGRDYLLAWDGRYMRVDANGTRLDPRIDANNGDAAGGQATLVVWWNGTTYSLLQQEETTAFNYRYRFVRVASNGTIVKVSDPVAPPGALTWVSGGNTCQGMTCTLVDGVLEYGPPLLRELRIVDDDVRPTIAFQPATLLTPAPHRPATASSTAVTVAAFRLPGGRLHAVFPRFVLEQPHAGIARVFLRAMDGGRGRVVRH